MKIIFSIVILFIIFLLLPFVNGVMLNCIFGDDQEGFSSNYVLGLIFLLALFQVLAVPLIFMGKSLSFLIVIWCSCISVSTAAAVILYYQNLLKLCMSFGTFVKTMSIGEWGLIFLIFLQVIAYIMFVHIDDDDAFYVASSTAAVETNTMYKINPYTGDDYSSPPIRYVMAPLPLFTAMLSVLTGIHPAIMAHTIMPIVFVPAAYLVWCILGNLLLEKRRDLLVQYMYFVCIMNIFGGFSIFSTSMFLLVRIWQGKAILANIILPYILFLGMKKNNLEWQCLLITTTAACMVSSMGVILVPIAVCAIGSATAFIYKKPFNFLKAVTCCLPCFICGVTYILIR